MSKEFGIYDWYWFLDGDQTRVYSSARGDFFPVSDSAYVAWAADGTRTYSTTSDGLAATLAQYNLRPIAAAILDSFKTVQAGSIVNQAIFKILFNHENRIRAIERNLSLNGSPPNLTPAQALAAVKVLI